MPFFIADNIITSLGLTSEENFEALKKGETGVLQIDEPSIYKDPFPASMVNHSAIEEKFKAFAKPGQFTRLEKMMIVSIRDAVQQTNIDIRSERTAFIISTTKGNIDLLEPALKNSFPSDRLELWKLGEVITNFFGNPNRPIVLSNACISGVLAINLSAMLINAGRYDHIIVCGGDLVSRFVVSGFMSFLSLSPKPCCPFDKNRDGLSLGEAAGTIILSKEKSGNNDMAWIGGASANDANHISGPSRTAEGSFIAIQNALTEAGINSREIDHISAHGTATPYNDEMESISINRHGLESVPVNSIKGYWGHTLGAAGVIETIALLYEMRENTLIKTAGFEELGVYNPINMIKENQDKNLTTCLKMASGFGGSNAALVLQKVDKEQGRSQQSAVGSRQLAVGSRKLAVTNHKSQITNYCHIKNNKIFLDGELVYENNEVGNLKSFSVKAFRHFKFKYPKFFKMDEISKLGFLTAELLLQQKAIQNPGESVGIVLSNSQSTLVTDTIFQQSINNTDEFFPSPSVFVYTLPNIMIGEISIRHKFNGENAFFIFDRFNARFITDYINLLFSNNKINHCLGGWVDQSSDDYEAFMYLASNETDQTKAIDHSAGNVMKLYELY